MGAANVGAVLTTWHSLPPRARLVLITMAHLSYDAPRPGAPARQYWAGPGHLAEVLYGPDGVAGRDDNGNAIATPSAGRQVEKVITQLIDAGALIRLTIGGKNHRARYEVVLTPPVEDTPSPTDLVGLTDSQPDQIGYVSPTISGNQPDHFGYVSPTFLVGPRRKEEKEEYRGTMAGEVSTSPALADVHVTEGGKRWSDVPVLSLGTDGYAAANAFLERTIGTTAAGDAVAGYVAQGSSYVDAVVTAAWNAGWEPEGPP
jgi:hypothetical protein